MRIRGNFEKRKQLPIFWDRSFHTMQRESLCKSSDRPHVATVTCPIESAIASLREGLGETLTIIKLGIWDALCRTLRPTSPIENLIGLIAPNAERCCHRSDAALIRHRSASSKWRLSRCAWTRGGANAY